MFSIDKQRTSETLLYILLWGAIFFVPPLNTVLTSRDHIYIEDVLAAWFKISPFFLLFLLNNNYLAPRLLFKGRYLPYVIYTLLSIFVIFCWVDYIQEHLMSRFLARQLMEELVPGSISITDLNIWGNVLFSILMCSANDGLKLIYKSMRDDQLLEKLKRQNLQVEMDYLKYQLNPHFFMNTLNNIHALIDIDSESAKSAVIELSKMMRYVLYESGSESISLSNDLKFIVNYIELMRIRYEDDIKIQYRCSDDLPSGAVIPPLVLIVFVENAFKHGVGALGGENFIDIDIKYESSMLHYRVRNSLSRGSQRSKESGIGLINLRKRLELIYDDRFRMDCNIQNGEYLAHLIIPIDNA
ncbi:MAG: histidine kinase [Rikenellaceae bacterium]